MSYLQNNAGVNYTLYYNVLDYFKTIMQNHPSITQVQQGDIYEIDTIEYPFYTLGNVSILAANFTPTTTEYTIQLIIADKIKNKNNESEPRTNAQDVPFLGVNDVVDIHANTLGIVNDLVSYTQYSLESFAINSEITNEPFMDRFNNGLAGWVSTFTLTTHNDRPRCLYNLYPFNQEATVCNSTINWSVSTTSGSVDTNIIYVYVDEQEVARGTGNQSGSFTISGLHSVYVGGGIDGPGPVSSSLAALSASADGTTFFSQSTDFQTSTAFSSSCSITYDLAVVSVL